MSCSMNPSFDLERRFRSHVCIINFGFFSKNALFRATPCYAISLMITKRYLETNLFFTGTSLSSLGLDGNAIIFVAARRRSSGSEGVSSSGSSSLGCNAHRARVQRILYCFICAFVHLLVPSFHRFIYFCIYSSMRS